MPLYDYECSNCGHTIEDVLQGVDDKPLKRCPECGKHKLYKVVTGGIYSSVKEVNTIGSLADENYRKNKSKINEEYAKKKEIEEKNAPERPWYHKYGTATNKEISKMNESQKLRYIMEGKK